MIETAHSLAGAGRVRDAGRLLHDHLAEDPGNVELRRAIARIYRDAGHPDHTEIPDGFLSELADRRRKHAAIEAWDSLLSIASVAFVVLALVTVLLVYFLAVVGADGAVVIARVGGLACLAALATVTLGFAVSAWIRRSRRVAAALSAATLLLAGAAVTGTFMLVTQLAQSLSVVG